MTDTPAAATDHLPGTSAVADIPERADAVPSYWEASWRLAQRIATTPFVPAALRNRPEAVLAAVLYGHELGLGPMQSLASINVIDGRPAASPELMRALIARAGHRVDVVDSTDIAVTLTGQRADTGATATVTWSTADAQRAGLMTKSNWRQYPRAMLLARATSELARTLFADVIAGLSYTPEEISHVPDWNAPTEPLGDGITHAELLARYDRTTSTDDEPDPALELYDRVRKHAGTSIAVHLRELADQTGRRLTRSDFHDHPSWAATVSDVLDQLEHQADTDIVDAELVDPDHGIARADSAPAVPEPDTDAGEEPTR
jgi:hypothetical protein